MPSKDMELIPAIVDKHGDALVWYEVETGEDYVIYKFDSSEVAEATEVKYNERSRVDISDIFSMWAVSKYLGRSDFSPANFVKNPERVYRFSGRIFRVKHCHPTWELRYHRTAKIPEDEVMIITYDWGYDKYIRRIRIGGWFDARVFRTRSILRDERRKTVKVFPLVKLMSPLKISRVWCDCDKCK